MIGKKIVRIIRGYEKKGDQLLFEYPIKQELEVTTLQKIFNISDDNPMYDCYKINIDQKTMLKDLITFDLDIEKYDFFLECDLIDS